MKINSLSCGFRVDLDETYDDFEGPIKCICGALLEIKIDEGELNCNWFHDQPRFNRTELLEWATARRMSIAVDQFIDDADNDPYSVPPLEADEKPDPGDDADGSADGNASGGGNR